MFLKRNIVIIIFLIVTLSGCSQISTKTAQDK